MDVMQLAVLGMLASIALYVVSAFIADRITAWFDTPRPMATRRHGNDHISN